jgi:hypothetical protein
MFGSKHLLPVVSELRTDKQVAASLNTYKAMTNEYGIKYV